MDISTVALVSGVLPCNQKVNVICCASFNELMRCSEGCFSVLTHSHASLHVSLIFIFQTGKNTWFHNTAGYPSQGIQLHVIEHPELFQNNNQHDDTYELSFISGVVVIHPLVLLHVGEREGYSKRLHSMPEAACTGKNELLIMSFPKARNM